MQHWKRNFVVENRSNPRFIYTVYSYMYILIYLFGQSQLKVAGIYEEQLCDWKS